MRIPESGLTLTKEVIEELDKAGVALHLNLPFGYGAVPINYDDALRLLHDSERFIAGKLNTTVENLRLWNEFQKEDFRCRAYTKKGTGPRCKLMCLDRYELGYGRELAVFVRSVTDMCTIHKGYR